MPALLELDRVTARYGPVQALHGVSLDVDEGQIAAVLGANGAGKTTTLKSIVGALPLAGGTIEFAGRPIAGMSPESLVTEGISPPRDGHYLSLLSEIYMPTSRI